MGDYPSYLSLQTIKVLFIQEIKKKEYGTQRLIEGRRKKGQRVLIIDDVITGGSLKESYTGKRYTKIKSYCLFGCCK